MEQEGPRVVVGMDPHKRSVTIEVMDAEENVLGGGRFGTELTGYRSMLDYLKRWPDRVWAIEGCSGIGRHIAMRLLADGQEIVDVPPKLADDPFREERLFMERYQPVRVTARDPSA